MENSEKIEKILEIDPIETKDKIVKFIREKIEDAGAGGTVLGLSGGLDSSAAAFLCAEALGEENVLAVFMPEEGVTSPENFEDVKKIADELGIKLQNVEISPILGGVKDEIGFDEEEKIANANLKARIRMLILYYYANLLGYLVVGTSNRSELRCGYFTKYGDGAADLLPMGSLYKTQVRKIAQEVGVPQDIIDKTPSAGLWKGQKDEEELGLSYDKIDRIYAGADAGLNDSEIADAIAVEKSTVQEFKSREESSKHKLQKPPAPKL